MADKTIGMKTLNKYMNSTWHCLCYYQRQLIFQN